MINILFIIVLRLGSTNQQGCYQPIFSNLDDNDPPKEDSTTIDLESLKNE